MIAALPQDPTAWDIVRRTALVCPSLFNDMLEQEAADLRKLASRLEPSRASLSGSTAAMVELASRLEIAAFSLREDGEGELQHYCVHVDGYKPPHDALRRALVAIAGRLTCVTTHEMEYALQEVR